MNHFFSGSLAKPWTVALAAGVLTSVIWLPQAAQGELVYEDNSTQPARAADATRIEERGVLRQALGAAERARDSREAQQNLSAGSAAPVLAPAPVAVTPQPQDAAPLAEPSAELGAAPAPSVARTGDSVEDLRQMNKTELMRRERVREELRNEDALQERLEELRLRDEKRRTDQILGVPGNATAGAAGSTGPASVSMPTPLYGGVQEQTVTPPVTERPGEAPAKGRQAAAASGVAGATGPSGASQLAGVASQNPADASVIAASMDLEKPKDKSVFYVMPRAGLGAMSSQGGYDVNARFAGGLALGVATSDYLSFELGYTYAEYGVNIASGNPFVQQLQSMQYPYGGNANANTLTLKQNVVDAGVKLHLLEPASRIRPFLGGGAAWSKGFINYDQRILNALKQNPYFANSPLTSDYEMTSYMGYLSGGLDVKMNQSITLGLMAKYYAVLSSNENSQLLNYAFYNPGYAGQAPEKQMVGGSMGKTNFFTLMAGMSFAF